MKTAAELDKRHDTLTRLLTLARRLAEDPTPLPAAVRDAARASKSTQH